MDKAEQSGNGKFRFGVFEIDLDQGELRKSGVRLKLQDQPFRILKMLVERPGEIVSREELRHELWSDDTFVDFDHSLNTAVNKLREVLSDSVTSPRYVETIPKRGYRFVAPVERLGQAGALPVASKPEPDQPAPGNRRVWWVAAAAVAALAAAISVFYYFRAGSAPNVTLQPRPLTSFSGAEDSPRLSPDGSRLAFVRKGGQGELPGVIYTLLVGTESAQRLTNSESDDSDPVWSPDGLHIAFLRQTSDRCAILAIPAGGGLEKALGEVQGPKFFPGDGTRLDWHPGGKWLAVTDRQTAAEPSAIFLLSVETREERRLTSPSAGLLGDFSPVFSSDGRRIVFRRSRAYGFDDLLVLNLTEDLRPAGDPVLVNSAYRYNRFPAWTADNEAIVFSSGQPGNEGLWRSPVSGSGKPEQILFAGLGARSPSISRQGRRLVYAQLRFDPNIWALDLARPGAAASTPRMLESSTRRDMNPGFSPDGRRIAFESERTGAREVWVSDRDGSRAVRLTDLGHGVMTGHPRWSPDGHSILLESGISGTRNIYQIHPDGGVPRSLIADSFDNAHAVMSRDGSWIYFSSTRSGSMQIWKLPPGGGKPVQVTRNGGANPVESHDGKRIFYAKTDSWVTSLWSVPPEGGAENEIIRSLSASVNFAVAREGIYYIPQAAADGRNYLMFYEFASKKSRQLIRLQKRPGWGMDLSPDGRTLLYSQYDQFDTDLMLVENFQ